MTELLERYRLNAEKCLELAQTSNNLEAKRSLLVMANAWLMLAAQRKKNIETARANAPRASEPPAPVNEPPPPPSKPPASPPIDEPSKPPVNEPPPTKDLPMRLDAAKPDGPMQC